MSTKVVRDPIHGNILLDEAAIGLLDSPRMQRLRNVKQNGLCYLVYPAMNSTRFEHSLGVYHLSRLLSGHMGLSAKDSLNVTCAALLHDIGHGPFSHSFDMIFAEHGLNHEEVSCKLVCEKEIADILVAHHADPREIADLIRGKGRFGKLISSEVDVDKMDYLVRDAYYAGVAYGITDVERLLYRLALKKSDIIVEKGGLEAAESLLINRSMMYRTVYRHHTKRIAESMLAYAVAKMICAGADVKKIMELDDIGLVCTLRSCGGYPQRMMERIDKRHLFKCVFSETISSFDAACRTELAESHTKVQDNIAENLGIDDGLILLDWPDSAMNEYRVLINSAQGLATIDEVSGLARSLRIAEESQLTVNIYVDPQAEDLMKNFEPQDYFTYEQIRLSGFV